jgi:hypothetical protein
VQVFPSNAQAGQADLITGWDSSMPSLSSWQGSDAVPQAAEQVVPELAERTPQEVLLDLVCRDLSVSRGDQIWIMRADDTEARQLTDTPAALHGSLNWSPDGNLLLYDLYSLESFALQSSLQVIEVDSGETTDLGLYGYNPKWLWPR